MDESEAKHPPIDGQRMAKPTNNIVHDISERSDLDKLPSAIFPVRKATYDYSNPSIMKQRQEKKSEYNV